MQKDDIEFVLKIKISKKEYDYLKNKDLINANVMDVYIAVLNYRYDLISKMESKIEDTFITLSKLLEKISL